MAGIAVGLNAGHVVTKRPAQPRQSRRKGVRRRSSREGGRAGGGRASVWLANQLVGVASLRCRRRPAIPGSPDGRQRGPPSGPIIAAHERASRVATAEVGAVLALIALSAFAAGGARRA